jgi:hypothetical protein
MNLFALTVSWAMDVWKHHDASASGIRTVGRGQGRYVQEGQGDGVILDPFNVLD